MCVMITLGNLIRASAVISYWQQYSSCCWVIKLLTVLAYVIFPRTLVPVCVIYYNKILSFSCWQMTCNIYKGLGFSPVETFQIK